MGARDWGDPPQQSTSDSTTGQSTSVLLAEISSLAAGIYEARWIVGASTNATWALEHALSSGIGSSALRDSLTVYTPPNQSAEYIQTYKVEDGDRLRARITSTVALVAAHLSIERLT